MIRKASAILLSICIILLHSMSGYASDRAKHEEDLKAVLFGDAYYKYAHSDVSETIKSIEYAMFLAIDQYNGSGQKELDYLNERKIPDIPSSIDAIDFKSNSLHRVYTHRGWNCSYIDDKAHWPIRKKIMMNTVMKELFNGKNDPSIENFCILIYYVHILRDVLAADHYIVPKVVSPLVLPNNKETHGIIPELITCVSALFEKQRGSMTYISLKQELDYLYDQCEALMTSKGGIDTPEEFEAYHAYAENLQEVLRMYIPTLLMNESFFAEKFK